MLIQLLWRLPWYLLIGSTIGVMVVVALKKVINNEEGSGILYGSLKEAWCQMPSNIKPQLEVFQNLVLVFIAILITVLWLPSFLLELPAFFDGFVSKWREKDPEENEEEK